MALMGIVYCAMHFVDVDVNVNVNVYVGVGAGVCMCVWFHPVCGGCRRRPGSSKIA